VNAGNGGADHIASAQPRTGRHHVARRVNAGNGWADDIATSQPRTGRQHVARRVNAGNGGADHIASAQPRTGRVATGDERPLIVTFRSCERVFSPSSVTRA
jgi:hypothetical protein